MTATPTVAGAPPSRTRMPTAPSSRRAIARGRRARCGRARARGGAAGAGTPGPWSSSAEAAAHLGEHQRSAAGEREARERGVAVEVAAAVEGGHRRDLVAGDEELGLVAGQEQVDVARGGEERHHQGAALLRAPASVGGVETAQRREGRERLPHHQRVGAQHGRRGARRFFVRRACGRRWRRTRVRAGSRSARSGGTAVAARQAGWTGQAPPARRRRGGSRASRPTPCSGPGARRRARAAVR